MMFVSSSLTRVWFGSRFVSCSLPRTKHARAICHLFSGNYKSVVPYLIDYQSHCSDFDLLLLGTKVFKKLRVLLELFKLAWRSWPLVIRSLSDASYEMESLAECDSRESLNGKRKLPFFFLYFAFSLKIRLVLISVIRRDCKPLRCCYKKGLRHD